MARLEIITIEDEIKKLIEAGVQKESFIYDFISFYDIPKSTITRIRKAQSSQIKNKLHFEHLTNEQTPISRIAEIELELQDKKSKPRYIIVTNFLEWAAKDTKTAETLIIPFEELPSRADFFLAWNGIEKVDYAKENPADLKAAERFTKLYDELRRINQFSDDTVAEHEFNRFLIRLLFLLFAEDTEIMPKAILTNAIKTRSSEDGQDLNDLFNEIFEILDVPQRQSLADWLSEFPYVNGKLFSHARTDLVFDRKTRQLIVEAGELLNWREINPDILGSMIQTVASAEHRSRSGMHYTSVENIMKLIGPLFLDNFKQTFEAIQDKINANEDKNITEQTRRNNRKQYARELEELHERIARVKFFDPACGSGNFLIITYKEIRRLEIKILKALRQLRDDNSIDFFEESKISLNHFYGIELDDFAHEVARLSLWIAEYQMNVEANEEINLKSAFLPLRDAGNITCGNALRLNWEEVLPHTSEDEIYIIGNPPYIGAKLQNKGQKEDLLLTITDKYKYKKMDYIAGWFFKGVAFIQDTNAKLAFVTTNSIFQGEQVAFIWKALQEKSVIEFAYTSFKWGNSAANNAGVTVAIVGLANPQNVKKDRLLFDEYLSKKVVDNINSYLSSGSSIVVESERHSISHLPKMVFGSMPRDGGFLIISDSHEYHSLISEYPELKLHIKKYIGSEEFIKGSERYVFWLDKETYRQVKENPIVSERVTKVRNNRLASKAGSTQQAAGTPYAFVQRGEWDSAYQAFQNSSTGEFMQIIVPRVSSENRDYVPMGIVFEDTIVSDSAMAIYNAPIWLLGLLESRLHMVWLRSIGGKLKTDYRYSAGLVYNTFPVPKLSGKRKAMIEDKVFEILDLREELGGTLAELYHRDTMPASLRKAHQELDEIVERAYKETPFTSDDDRLSHLLQRYQEMKGK